MRKWTLALLCILFAAPASASDIVAKYIPNAAVVGSGNLHVMLWDVYDATLYAPSGNWDSNKAFALSIDYNRDIDGEDIADRSAEEIRKLGYSDEVKLAAWHSEMRRLFPNVRAGTELIGFYAPNKATIFYHDGKRIGAVQDPEFGKWFFDIWLSKNTSEPELRAALLGKR